MREDVQCALSGDKPSPKRGLIHDDYTVGWICPLEVELIAALEMLDEEHEGLPQPSSDHTVYTLGSINGKNVVIAGLWKPGNNAAATVVTQMRMTFPNIRFCLLVGIGGGVPAMTEQGRIRLGDVVVSKPTGIHSGVVQYDHGKAYRGRFERTGALAPPPAVLLQAGQDLAARRARWRRDPLVDNILRIDTTIPSLSRFRYPGADKDHLYQPEYVHREPGVSCGQCGCDPNQRIMDSPAEEADKDALPSIVVHRGTIASGELVVKDGVMRDHLAQEHGILCFEMETAGALADFPCLAIRGVSDYCDSHKNDDWHGYAAAAAAAYARQLLFHLPIDQVTRLEHAPKIERKFEKLVDLAEDHERQDILEFISTLDQGALQADMLSQRHESSGQWLLETEEFRSWIDNNQTLFCPGIPGAGKTIMTSIVIDHLQRQFRNTLTVGVVYFFCNFSQQSTITATTLIACLLRQLVQNMPHMPDAIRDLFARHKEHRIRPQFCDIYQCVNLVTSELSRVYIMIDALDECEEEVRSRILSQIFDLQSNCRLSFFATSRFVPDITSQFEQYPWLEIRAHPNDVKSYLSGQIANLRPFVRKDASLQELIIHSIPEAIDGMFLLARLYIDSLRKTPSVKLIKSALQRLPTGSSAYNHAYHAAMERINSQALDFQTLAKQVLSWLVCATERLTLTQLQHALGVEIGSSALDEENLPDIECLISACAGLVAFDEHSHIIRLVHYTTQQYFEQTWTNWFPNAYAEIAQTCITYLNFDAFETGACQDEFEFDRRLEENPLYKHAAFSWDFHARLQPVDENLLYSFLKDGRKVSACFQVLMTFEPSCDSSDDVSKRNTGLHLAAYLGFIPVVERLLADSDPNIENDWKQTPLSLAVKKCHEDVVKLLRTRGAAIDPKDDQGETPLFYAVGNKDVGMVKLLLDEGADPSVGDERAMKPFFHAAAFTRNEKICKLLLQNGRGLQVESETMAKNSLQFAAEHGSTRIVEVILDAGVDPTYRKSAAPSFHKGSIHHAPLCLAAKEGHEATVMFILERTKNHETAQQIEQVALLLSAQEGQEKIVKLLIQRGIDLDSKEHWGMTPLLIAVYYNQTGTVNALLESGASPDIGVPCRELDPLPSIRSYSWWIRELERVIQDFRDRAVDMMPLSLAAVRGNRAICRQLLLCTAATGEGKKQQLLWACYEGYEIVVEVLLEEDADPDCCDQAGRTPLSIAAERGYGAIARRLLEKDAMPGSKDITGQTPLSHALENGHKEMFYLLSRKHPRQLSCRDIFGRSLLLLSTEMDDRQLHNFILEATLANDSVRETICRDLALVQRNILCMDADLLRAFGGNCLLWAVRNDHCHIASQLLLNNVDPNHKDRNGATALAIAIKKDNEPLARSLLDSGANPNLEDRIGRTALSLALFHQSENLVLLLLEHNVDLSMRITGFWRCRPGRPFHGSYESEGDWSRQKSPLELAVCSGSENVIAAFSQDTAWSPADYEAALLQAVRTRKLVAIRRLLERRLDKDMIYDPLREAILDKQDDAVRILLNDGLGQHYILDEYGTKLMFTAARKGLNDVVKFMLDKGADCNCRLTNSIEKWKWDQGEFARTASLRVSNQPLLLIAAQDGHEAMVNLLLDYGADPSWKNDCGDYLLREAIGCRRHNVVETLCKKGLKLSSEGAESLLIEAAKGGVLPTVERLAGDIVENNWKGVALWWAVYNNRIAVVRMLLQAQADPNHQHSENGWVSVTPLFIATHRRAFACARALLGAGADPNIPNDRGRTPLSLAAENGQQPLMENLLDYQATVDLADEHNRTPLFFAAMNGHETAVKTLLGYGSATAHTLTSARRTALSVALDLGLEDIEFLLRDQNQVRQHFSPGSSDVNCAPLYCDNCCCKIRNSDSPHCQICSSPSERYCDMCNECRKGPFRKASCVSFECDNCSCGINDSDSHFHCPICLNPNERSFNLCLECFRSGSRCYDKLHALQKRTFNDENIVLERIIWPWSIYED